MLTATQARPSKDGLRRQSDVLRALESMLDDRITLSVSVTDAVPQDKVPLQKKLDQILEWIDLPLEERPQLIMG